MNMELFVEKQPNRILKGTRRVVIETELKDIKADDVVAITNLQNGKKCGAIVDHINDGRGKISMDENLLKDLKLGEIKNEMVKVEKIEPPDAKIIKLVISDDLKKERVLEEIREFLIRKPLSEGNELEFPYGGKYMETIKIGEVTPSGIAIVTKFTELDTGKQLVVSPPDPPTEHDDIIGDPSISFDDIGGLDDIKKNLNELAMNIAHDPTFEAGNILLYGPPGTGKTMLAEAIAKEVGGKIIELSAGSNLSEYFSKSEQNVKEIFSKARDWYQRKEEPVIIFIDEIHSFTSEDAERDRNFGRVADEFKKQIQKIADIRGIFVVGATNYRARISPVFLDRFCTYQFEVPLPDKEARKKIFGIGLRKKK